MGCHVPSAKLGSTPVTLPKHPGCPPAARMLEHLRERIPFPTSMAHHANTSTPKPPAQVSGSCTALLSPPQAPPKAQPGCISIKIPGCPRKSAVFNHFLDISRQPSAVKGCLALCHIPGLRQEHFQPSPMGCSHSLLVQQPQHHWEGNNLHYMTNFL